MKDNMGQNMSERAILFGPCAQEDLCRDETRLDELSRLVESAGGTVVGRMVQTLRKITPATYFGSGKVAELGEMANRLEADIAVFDRELSPAQARNLEMALGIRIVDRTELILDIFARRAATRQAQMQVSLAQLKYKLPRLKRMWTHLDRIHAAIGARGPGETQIESDRRLIRDSIVELNEKLETMKERQMRVIASRKNFKVSLVGYTNAGKSTLLNRLTGENVYVADKLFATLDTTTRKLHSPGLGLPVLVSDTVGFVSHLPHHLIDSFHATLAEAMEADLLLHVADASSPELEAQVSTVEAVLAKLGCGDIPTIFVANKMDVEGARHGLKDLQQRSSEVIAVSAVEGTGIPELITAIIADMSLAWTTCELLIPYKEGSMAAKIRQCSKLISEESRETGLFLRLEINPSDFSRLQLERYAHPARDA